MSVSRKARVNSLMPKGIPKYVRVYDFGEEHCDRYTVVYTGNYRGKGWFQYVGMSAAPFHPQGVCQHGETPNQVDVVKGWPPAMGRKGHLGKRISFNDLPKDCQKVVMRDYMTLWNLSSCDIDLIDLIEKFPVINDIPMPNHFGGIGDDER